MRPKKSARLDIYAHGGPEITTRSRFIKSPDVFRSGIQRQDYDKKSPGGEMSKMIEKPVRSKKGDSQMKAKKSAMRDVAYARGGADRMFREQSAGKARPGITGKVQTPAPGAKAASGGPKTRGVSVVVPAVPGKTAPPRKGR